MTDTLQPIGVTVIGTGDGNKVPDGTVAQTPSNAQPNIVVTVITPALALAVRFLNVYLTLLSGVLIAGMTTNLIPANDFAELVWKAAQLSVSGAVVSFLKDLVTVFGRLEGKYPLLTGSV